MGTEWVPVDLRGRVAVVTGASRGVGRGIAEVLGACGATVFVTGRSRRGVAEGHSIDDTADTVTALGGRGIAVECDHADADQIESLFAEVAAQGRLDVLVNNVIGWSDAEIDSSVADADGMVQMAAPVWQRHVSAWDGNFSVGLRSHFVACRHGLPLMFDTGRGLVVFTTEPPAKDPNPDLSIDVRAHATARFVFSLAGQLRSTGMPAVGIFPGFPRTEGIQANWEAGHSYFDGWSEQEYFDRTESPHLSGRAVAHLAADDDAMTYSGQVVGVSELADHYGFPDGDLPI